MIKSRRMWWSGHLAHMGKERRIQCFGGETWKGKRPLGRPRRRWENNIKTDLQEVEFGGMDWIELHQDGDRWRALVNAIMTLGFHKMRGNSWLAEHRQASQEGLWAVCGARVSFVAIRKGGFFQIRLEHSIVTSIHLRLSDSDTPVARVKGDEDVANVYLFCGSTDVRDSCLVSRRV